jgi:hypothetical protein
MDALWWNIVLGIGLAGLLVAAINIRQAIFVGMGVGLFSLVAMFILSMSTLNPAQGSWNILVEILSKVGNVVALLCLMLFYTLYCVYANKEYIMDGNMPDTWYLFSYFVVGTFAINLWSIAGQFKNNSAGHKAFSWVITTLLLGFVLIETIVSTSFRTDGFTL